MTKLKNLFIEGMETIGLALFCIALGVVVLSILALIAIGIVHILDFFMPLLP